MQRTSRVFILAFVVGGLAPRARAVEGFTIGLEGQIGSWSVDAGQIVHGSLSDPNGPLTIDEAQGFAGPLDGHWRMGPNLHLGWNVLGHVAIEGAFQTAMWDAFDSQRRGGVGLVGGRVTWYPLQLVQNYVKLPHRERYDLGLELGYGYALGGGNTVAGGQGFGMAGAYLAYGIDFEGYIEPWVSVELDWRYYTPYWSTFYLDFNNDVTRSITGFSASWNTFGLGVSFHLSAQK